MIYTIDSIASYKQAEIRSSSEESTSFCKRTKRAGQERSSGV